MEYANKVNVVRIECTCIYIEARCVKVVARRTRHNFSCDLVVSFCIGVFSGFLRVKYFNKSVLMQRLLNVVLSLK